MQFGIGIGIPVSLYAHTSCAQQAVTAGPIMAWTGQALLMSDDGLRRLMHGDHSPPPAPFVPLLHARPARCWWAGATEAGSSGCWVLGDTALALTKAAIVLAPSACLLMLCVSFAFVALYMPLRTALVKQQKHCAENDALVQTGLAELDAAVLEHANYLQELKQHSDYLCEMVETMDAPQEANATMRAVPDTSMAMSKAMQLDRTPLPPQSDGGHGAIPRMADSVALAQSRQQEAEQQQALATMQAQQQARLAAQEMATKQATLDLRAEAARVKEMARAAVAQQQTEARTAAAAREAQAYEAGRRAEAYEVAARHAHASPVRALAMSETPTYRGTAGDAVHAPISQANPGYTVAYEVLHSPRAPVCSSVPPRSAPGPAHCVQSMYRTGPSARSTAPPPQSMTSVTPGMAASRLPPVTPGVAASQSQCFCAEAAGFTEVPQGQHGALAAPLQPQGSPATCASSDLLLRRQARLSLAQDL